MRLPSSRLHITLSWEARWTGGSCLPSLDRYASYLPRLSIHVALDEEGAMGRVVPSYFEQSPIAPSLQVALDMPQATRSFRARTSQELGRREGTSCLRYVDKPAYIDGMFEPQDREITVA